MSLLNLTRPRPHEDTQGTIQLPKESHLMPSEIPLRVQALDMTNTTQNLKETCALLWWSLELGEMCKKTPDTQIPPVLCDTCRYLHLRSVSHLGQMAVFCYHSRCLRFSPLIFICHSRNTWNTYWSSNYAASSMQMAWTLEDWMSITR